MVAWIDIYILFFLSVGHIVPVEWHQLSAPTQVSLQKNLQFPNCLALNGLLHTVSTGSDLLTLRTISHHFLGPSCFHVLGLDS